MNLSESHIHFIGIGGIGMSGIAEVLSNMGCKVSGSDLSQNAQVDRLKAMGINILQGHAPKNIPEKCDAVVYSSAVKENNVELREARKRSVPAIKRAEMLAELMRLKRGIAIGGSHGKTTTTSMVAAVLLRAGLDPTIVIGGRLDLIKSTAALGKGEWLLAEADESDGSFLHLSPEISVITNIDNDHMDHFKNFETLVKAFGEFASRVPFYGCAVFCSDDKNVLKLANNFNKRFMTYGLGKAARLQATQLQTKGTGQTFEVTLDGKVLGDIVLSVPGRHNALNALAAIAIGLELKLDFQTIREGLSHFSGVDRRLQRRGEFNGALVIDDYGHHPTEVEATLKALRDVYPKSRIVVAFQPHRFTRTKTCWKQFTKSFKSADVVGMLDIYSAGEKAMSGITSQKLAKAMGGEKKQVFHWGSVKQAEKKAHAFLKDGDVFLTLGAGDVWKLGAALTKSTAHSS